MRRDKLVFLLGGCDLEMVEIAKLIRECPEAWMVDFHLRWDEASTDRYAWHLWKVAEAGLVAAMVELRIDRHPEQLFARKRWATIENERKAVTEIVGLKDDQWLVIDHHNERAGLDKPSSLRQVFDLLEAAPDRWTRRRSLVQANDIGHIEGLQAIDASDEEIRRIRLEDRRAQGVTAKDDLQAASAVAAAVERRGLLIVQLDHRRTSAVTDHVALADLRRRPPNLLIRTPETIEYYGSGQAVLVLRARFGGWSGGALPARGFWGIEPTSAQVDFDEVAVLASEHWCGAS